MFFFFFNVRGKYGSEISSMYHLTFQSVFDKAKGKGIKVKINILIYMHMVFHTYVCS